MTNKEITLHYILVVMVLVFEVTVFFLAMESPIRRLISLIPFIILFILFINRIGIREIEFSFISVVIFVIVLILIQGYFFGFSLMTVVTYPLYVLFIPYLLYKIIGIRIFKYLLNVIYYTAIIASAIWLLQVVVSPFNDLFQHLRLSSGIPFIRGDEFNNRVSIAFFYTISHWKVDVLGVGILRNSGLYHEPGAFAYFLIIAIGINTILQQNIMNNKNIIMIIMIITTFSTAGYLALFVLLVFMIIDSNIHGGIKIFLIPSIIVLIFISYTQIDFMQDKIVASYEDQRLTQVDGEIVFEGGRGRVWRMESAINLLSTSPLIGRGIITAARDFEPGSPYYFTGAGIWRTLASYGLLFAPLLYLMYYAGIRKLCVAYNYNAAFAVFFFIAIAIGATSQRFFMDSITILFFIHGLITPYLQINNTVDDYD